jgi:hypothetical protein
MLVILCSFEISGCVHIIAYVIDLVVEAYSIQLMHSCSLVVEGH